MQKQLMDWYGQVGADFMESARKLTELNLGLMDRIGRQQLEWTGHCLDTGVRGLELMAQAKAYDDLAAGQAGLMREWGERQLETLRQTLSLTQGASGEYHALAQEGWQLFRERMAGLAMPA